MPRHATLERSSRIPADFNWYSTMRPISLALTGLFFGLLTGPAARAEGLPQQTLADLKKATVFIQVGTGRASQTGTGFLIRVDGDTGYVVTNHHVITIEGPARAMAQLGRVRVIPGRSSVVSAATLVFHSGTKQEKSARATVVADDGVADLAVFKVGPLSDLPKPIDLTPSPELLETMPVYALGFPFGELLAVGKNANPAITVSRAAVSSIRADKQGGVTLVQLDSTLNPGNSGGPVVDDRGRLVGVAVARIRDSNIGLAIPAAELRLMLLGRVGTFKLMPKPAEGGGVTVAVEQHLADPFGKLREVAWHYRPASAGQVTEAPKGLAALPGGQRFELHRDGMNATGVFELTAAQAQGEIFVQSEYVNGEGQRSFTAIKPYRANMGAAVVARPPNAAPAAGSRTKLAAADIPRVLADLKSDNPAARQTALALLAHCRPVEERKAEVAKALEPFLKDSGDPGAAEAVKALGRWATPETVPALTAALESQNVVVRWAALDAIGYFPNSQTAAATAKRLCVAQDRFKASQALQQMGAKAETAVASYLTNADIGARLEACRILKMIGTKVSADALYKAADGNDNAVAQAAEEALQAIQGR